MYRLNCKPPCPEVREFRKEGMRPTASQTTCSKEGKQRKASTSWSRPRKDKRDSLIIIDSGPAFARGLRD